MDYQDLLMKMGVGSAHPGGYNATLRMLDHFLTGGGEKILEIGCGTGRTACELAARGYEVTAVDLRPDMIRKAKERAKKMDRSPSFKVADLFSLPMTGDLFDIILIESLTVFLDIKKAIDRYSSLLRPGGRIFDREMMARDPFPTALFQELSSFYGISSLPTPEGWKRLFVHSGFTDLTIWDLQEVTTELENYINEKPDPYQLIDEGAFADQEIVQKTIQNTDLTLKAAPYLFHGVITGKKTS